jgi:anti-sigma factor RsiW
MAYSHFHIVIHHDHQMGLLHGEAERERLARQLPRRLRRDRSVVTSVPGWALVLLALVAAGLLGGLTPAASARQTQSSTSPVTTAGSARPAANMHCSVSGDVVGDANPATIRATQCGADPTKAR